MPPALTQTVDFLSSDVFGTVKLIILGYFALLWLAIIIWVTRDVLQRSGSIFLQAFSILLNIVVPFLGVLLYLIIRPGKTRMERYYEELERNVLESETPGDQNACGKCLTPVDKDFIFCPNCGENLKKTCLKCKKTFPIIWNICPFCGKDNKEAHKMKSDSKKPSES
jgi:RNA polymerase subunit RPABC4/transcription elongation factor Spt4